jgi:poly-gamma-glutamate synthase PgsB/CapB
MAYFAVLLGIVLVLLVAERALHGRSRRAIPHRIHVNGIRGKSSVTRLIAAGLRGGGMRTWAKVTGTLPNIIDADGREIPIARMNGGSLSEQRTIFALAARERVDALVIECMAVQAKYQEVAEDAFVQSTIGVITNVRADHLEVYGDRFEGVAEALANTVPYRGVLFTTPGPAVATFEQVARERGSRVVAVEADEVDASALDTFEYYEHRENVAVALRVCAELGIDRDVALAAMATSRPDPGVLRVFEARFNARGDGHILHVINALAANDPDSTLFLHQRLIAGRWDCPLFVLVNTRRDRPLRSIQLGQLLAKIPAARYFVAGNDVRSVLNAARDAGVADAALIDCAHQPPQAIVERIFIEVQGQAVLFAIGNTAAGGLETIGALAAYEMQQGVA